GRQSSGSGPTAAGSSRPSAPPVPLPARHLPIRLHVRRPKPAMAPGGPDRRHPPSIGPSADRLGAHAEHPGDLTGAQRPLVLGTRGPFVEFHGYKTREGRKASQGI